MKEYDLAFSLGSSCGVSQALRAAGLQFASYPLDWLGSRDVRRVAKVVAGNFEKWFEKEDFRLVDVWHSTGFDTRAYLNTRTDFGFSHEFPDFVPFDESFPKIRETYERRVERFLKRAESVRRMLVVFMELPVAPRTPVEALAEVRRTLMERFPKADVDLLYVGVEPGKDLHVVMRTWPSHKTTIRGGFGARSVTYCFSNPLRIGVLVDGEDAGTRDFAIGDNGFSDIEMSIDGRLIKDNSVRLEFLGDHIACSYWFWQ